LTYALGCRLLHRPLGQGSLSTPLLAGSLFVAAFFVLGTLLGLPEGVLRTAALFFDLLGLLLVLGLSTIGIGAVLLSRLGTRPREIDYREAMAPLGAGPPAPVTPSADPTLAPPMAPGA
jgi:hypothetical protein